MNTKILIDPRQESFLQMLHYSICPLLKKHSFTFYICLFDFVFYLISILYQFSIQFSLRPHQQVLFKLGQLYPFYLKTEWWRLLISTEQHKNEIHLFFSLLFKLHLLSFVEHIISTKRIMIIYFTSNLTGVLFQTIISNQAGVCGSFHIGIVCYALYLQMQLLQKCTSQQQLQFYFDHQAAQDLGNGIIKIFLVFIIIWLISVKFWGIPIIGIMGFLIQPFLLGQYFQSDLKKSEQLQLINATKQIDFIKYIYLSASVLIIILELIIFLFVINHKEM